MLTGDGWHNWLDAGKRGGAKSRPAGNFEAEHDADWIAQQPNPLAEVNEIARENMYRTYMGMDHGGFVMGAPDTHTLAIGPARSSGKSSGWMCPAVMMHPGPVIICSAKLDNFRITAMARAMLGAVWVFSVAPMPEIHGVIQARWSPVVGAEDWDTAMHSSAAVIEATTRGGSKSDAGQFFEDSCTLLLAAFLHSAAIYDHPPYKPNAAEPYPLLPEAEGMEWVVQTLFSGRINTYFVPLMVDLYEQGRMRAAQALEAFLSNDPKTRANVLSSVTACLKCYQLDGVAEATRNANFDPRQFVTTDWSTPNNFDGTVPADPQLEAIGVKPTICHGRHDSLFILTGTNPKLTAPIIEALLAAVRYAAQKQFEHMEMTGSGRPANVLFALDELGSGAFIGDLDALLAIAGVGIQVIACIQSFEQLSQRYGDNTAKAFLTLFQNLLVWPGCRSIDLLNLIQALGGKYEREVWSMSTQRTPKGKPEQVWSMSYRESDRLPTWAVYNGHESSPDAVLFLPHGGGAHYIYNTPYFRANPWPATIIRTAGWTLARQVGDDLRIHLPMPNLDWDGQGTFLRGIDHGLYEEYLTVSRALENARREVPALPASPPAKSLRKA